MAEPTAPKAPAKPKLEGKKAPKALKTFVHSSTKDETNKTYLKGKRVTGFPSNLVAKYREAGLIEPEVKEEEEEAE